MLIDEPASAGDAKACQALADVRLKNFTAFSTL